MNKFKAIHILRIGLGLNMLMHGIMRVPKLDAFVTKAAIPFQDAFLPPVLVNIFLTTLPFLEAIIGITILIGGKISRLGYIAGGLLITLLIFGTDAHQDWALAGQQMVYLLTFAIALHLYDRETADSKITLP